MKRQRYQRASVPSSVLGLDFGKYLLSKNKQVTMESDVTTGTESDTSDLDPGRWRGHLSGNRSSVYSEDSDDYQGYNDDGRMLAGVYDTNIDSADDSFYDHQVQKGQKRAFEDENDIKIRQAIAQLNAPISNNNFGRPLYAIHETASVVSGSSVNDSDSQSGTPVHRPVYGRYQKLSNQNDHLSSSSNQDPEDSDSDSLETLVLHRLPGENLGMILGIEGGKDDSGNVSHVLVKSVTLGGAAYRATGSNRGVCVSDEILKVNGTDVRTLSHDECISVFKDMPLRVLIGVRRGQKNLPPVQISPDEAEKIDRKFDFQHSVNVHSNSRYDYSDSEEEKMSGFAIYKVRIEKQPYENLGLSIVPSYGSTKEFYQIKRILPSGAAAHSRQLQVGDRLITCNGHSLKRLTQNHCLNILKSASAKGDVHLEVIRPVDNGNPMEISVTLNNNSTQIPGLDNSQLSRFDNDSSRNTEFDPCQYSLKSLSYDRQVDVVITSESEDYLTLSEDEYSRNRLGNISEAKAHEIFSGTRPKLAYQKPFSAINALSSENGTLTETETETEGPNQKPKTSERDKEINIVDLSIDSSPYHIPKKLNSADNIKHNRTEKQDLTTTVSDLDNLIALSSAEHLNSEPDQFQSPKTDVDSIRSPTAVRQILTSDLNNDLVIIDSDVPKTVETTPIGEPYKHPRQQLPTSEIDFVSFEPNTEETEPLETEDIETGNQYYSDFNTGICGIEYPENHLYLDNNGVSYSEEDYELSDSEKYFQPVSDSEEETGSALPPPAEFSDSNYTGEFEDNQVTAIPVSYIDDFTDDFSEPIHQDIEIVSSEQEQEYPEAELAKLEASLRDLDEASSDQPSIVPYLEPVEEDFELLHHSNLPLNYEVTINDQGVPYNDVAEFDTNESKLPSDYEITVSNQIVPQRYDNVHYAPYDFSESKEALQVVKDTKQGQVIVTQFIPPNTSHSSAFDELGNCNNNSTMDTTSETMLKNALDMEYDMIPESEKFQTRIILADNGQPEMAELDDPSFMNQNMVAECLAQEMIQSEQNNYGYYMESDDEPDNMPDQDMHDEAPDLPDLPPPILNKQLENNQSVLSNDPNWSFRAKDSEASGIVSEQEISPTKVERTSDVRVQISVPKGRKSDPKTESDIIVPVKVERKQNIPTQIFVSNENREVLAPKAEVIIEPKATMTVSAVKPKVPPTVAPKPSPRKINENKQLGKNVTVVQLQHVDEYADKTPVDEPIVKPVKVTKDKAQSVMNVVKVVSALKGQNGPSERPVSPKAVRFIEEVKQNGNERQSPPPKRDIIETNKDTIHKPKAESGVKDIVKKIQEISQESHNSHERNDKSPVRYKTQIQHAGKPEPKVVSHEVQVVSHEPKATNPEPKVISNEKLISQEPPPVAPKPKTRIIEPEVISHEAKVDIKPEQVKLNSLIIPQLKDVDIPPLHLDTLESSESGSFSPKSDKSDRSYEKIPESKQEIKPETVHKTTIGISKPGISNKDISNKDVTPISEKKHNAPVSEVKQLSQIKPLSFNPKSLSKPQPVQYKTTINTLGSKPGGISTLGRSSLLSTQKAEHPIKRMETMPFEVSILKGILGIGIKTKITPEGYVQITEILPSGPVGREGNIKVGDYLLSINNTELTGLPDGKVQQILRLLPRGLSKITASAVPPEQEDTKANVIPEKKAVSPRTSVPLAASRQPPLSAGQKSATLPFSRGQVNVTVPRQPVVSTRSLPFASKPFGSQPKEVEQQVKKQTESPVTSPKSLKSPKLAPALAPRKRQKHSASSGSPDVSPRSPPLSPRKAESEKSSTDSEKSSPRTPPRVAPKPRRDIHTNESVMKPKDSEMKHHIADEAGPIETEIFASITGPKSEHIPSPLSGPSILPGSVTLDFVPTVDNIGKVDVVEITESQPVTETKLEQATVAPQHETPVHIDVVENTVQMPVYAMNTENLLEIDLSIQANVDEAKETEHESNTDICVQKTKEIDLDSDKKSKTPPPVSPKPQRKLDTEESLTKPNEQIHEESIPLETIQTKTEILIPDTKIDNEQKGTEPSSDTKHNMHESGSATNSDYHFRALEHIDDFVESIETRQERSASVSSESSYDDFKQCDVQDESNLEDIVEEIDTDMSATYSAIKEKDDLHDEQMEVYKSMAEHIVADVIETVKAMDLSERKTESPELSVEIQNDIQGTVNEHSEIPINSDDSPPPLPESDAPPLPLSPPPVTDTVFADQFADLNSEQEGSHDSFPSATSHIDTEQKEISSAHSFEPPPFSPIDEVIEISHTSQVHASIPTVVVSVHPDDVDDKLIVEDNSAVNDENTVYSQEKIGVDTEELVEYSDDFDESSVASETEEFKDAVTETDKSDSYHSVLSTKDENLDDQSVNTVISMYKDIGKSTDTNRNIETVGHKENDTLTDKSKTLDGELQMLESKDLASDENESVDTKSLTSSDDVLSEGDINENQENNDSQTLRDNEIPKTETSQGDPERKKMNGFSQGDLGRPKDLRRDLGSDKADSSFSSDSAMSPARSGTPHSDDDRVDVDRMIRLLSTDSEPQHSGDGEVIEVKMYKGVTGVGFVIQGGKGSPKGDQPITIKRIFKGGPADQCGQLQVNDEILDANGEDFTGMRHSEAWQHLKFLPSGAVTLKIRRFSP